MNYQLILDNTLKSLKAVRPTLLLQACCAPCSSYCIEYLAHYFDITIYFCNPNISPESEFDKRFAELERLCREMPSEYPPKVVSAAYNHDAFLKMAEGYEAAPEGGARCALCYRQRLELTAEYAAAHDFDYFCTTLSISPYKHADWLNRIGQALQQKYGVSYLFSDFKKRGGYKRSIELSEKYGLYRQDFCGCEFSRAERDKKHAADDKRKEHNI